MKLIAMSLKRSSTRAVSHAQLVDTVIDAYVTWREESAAVSASYQDWRQAPRDRRDAAFHAYVVALDREEYAAAEYERLIEHAATG